MTSNEEMAEKLAEKFYGLIEFPYPSGQGLHVGHPRPFTAMDIVTRKKRMEGYNVLYPIGFDAFGLPTENYAIKNHIHPAIVTKQNIANFTSQLKMLGYGFDWDRCIDTTDPSYYKWTQWIFQQMFKRGLAYKATMPVNWCTSCKCVLANEEVVNGVCERCGSEVIRKEKSQWMLKIWRTWTTSSVSRSSSATGSAVPPEPRSPSRPTSVTRSPSIPPVPIPCSAPPIWSSPRSIPC